jgi:vacuolar-type H+-ATPase subunit H
MAQQPPATDKYSKLAGLYQKALTDADKSDDPEAYRERVRSAYDKAVAKAAQESAPKPAEPALPPPIEAEGVVKPRMGTMQAIGTAIATGLLPESLAGIGAQMQRPAGESADAAYQRGMRELGQKEEQAQEAIGTVPFLLTNMAGGAKTAMKVAPGIGARVAKDATALAKAIAAGKRVAGAGYAGALESAGRQGMSDKELSTAQSAGLAAGVTSALELGFPLAGGAIRGISRIPVVGQGIKEMAKGAVAPLAEATTQARRGAADYLAPRFPQVAQAIEPSDVIKMQRMAARTLPSGMTAEAVGESAGKAKQAAEAIGTALKTAEEKVSTATERAVARGKRVMSIGKEQAKREAQRILGDAEGQAQDLIGGLRVETPNTSAIQDVVRSFQLNEGKVSYDLVKKIGRPPEVDPEVYREMARDPNLRSAYQSAAGIIRGEAQEAAPGMPISEGLRSIQIDGREFPELSLEMFDQVRRKIMEPAVRTAEGTTGLSLSAKRAAIKQINRLEERFLAGYGKDEAATAIKNARAQYRARFEQLEALQDGLSIGMAEAGKAAKVVGKNRMELDEFVRRAEAYQGASKEMFKAGAAKWWDNLVTEGLGDEAVKFLGNATKSEGQLRRLRLVFDDETIAKMQQFASAPSVAKKARKATTTRAGGIAGRVLARGQEQASKATTEAQSLAAQLSEQRSRAAELLNTSRRAQLVERALGDTPEAMRAQDTFMGTVMGRLGEQGQRTMRDVAGSDIQRLLAGLTPAEARKRIQVLQQNPVARKLVGSQLDELLAKTEQRQSLVGPTRAALIGQAAGRL